VPATTEPRWTDPEAAQEPYRSDEGDRARGELNMLRADESRLQGEVKTLDEEAGMDFGGEGAFRKLKGQCFDLRVNQYTYTACPFGRASQDSTTLGNFGGWEEVAAAAGGGTEKVMKFTGGTRCWNGPDRSLTLHFECGFRDALLSVDEPEKCAYRGRFATPAACDGKFARELQMELEAGEGGAGSSRDEL
jgi:protein kinase C substrate 80K-H